jgi:LacI family transcriptional regulator
MPHASDRRGGRPTVVLTVGTELAQGIADHLPAAAWELLLCRPDELSFVVRNPERMGLAGAILQGVEPGVARPLLASGIAVVLIDQPPQRDLATVSSDGIGIGEQAHRALRARGFRRFGYWGVSAYWTSTQRQAGFAAAIARAGDELIPGERIVMTSFTDIMKTATAWLRAAAKPVAIFTDNALRALEMLWAARLAGLRVPEQVAILAGTEDPVRCTLNHPTLSAVDPGHAAMGRMAASLLEESMRGAPKRRSLSIPLQRIIERRSTDTFADLPGPVAAALGFIHQRAGAGIGVVDVVHEVAIPRRTLEAAFRGHLDRSIGEAIAIARVERARGLLEETRLGLADICERSGFSYPSLLSRVFKRHTGITPREFRRRYGRPD